MIHLFHQRIYSIEDDEVWSQEILSFEGYLGFGRVWEMSVVIRLWHNEVHSSRPYALTRLNSGVSAEKLCPYRIALPRLVSFKPSRQRGAWLGNRGIPHDENKENH